MRATFASCCVTLECARGKLCLLRVDAFKLIAAASWWSFDMRPEKGVNRLIRVLQERSCNEAKGMSCLADTLQANERMSALAASGSVELCRRALWLLLALFDSS